MDTGDLLDIGLTVLFLVLAFLFFFRYYRFKKLSCMTLGIFFFVDALGFTSFDVGHIGINKEIYDLFQMLATYIVTAFIVVVLSLNTKNKDLG